MRARTFRRRNVPHCPGAGTCEIRPYRPPVALAPAARTCGSGDEVVTAGGEPAPYTGATMTVTVQTPTAEEQPGQWFSIKVAADRLSVSERTVSRWLTRGKLRRRYREDGHVEVWVSLATTDTDADVCRDDGPDIDGHERSLQLLERVDAVLTRQQQPLVDRIDALVERVEAVARENGQLAERNTALTRELDTVRTATAHAGARVRPLAIALVVATTLAVAAVLAPAWVR